MSETKSKTRKAKVQAVTLSIPGVRDANGDPLVVTVYARDYSSREAQAKIVDSFVTSAPADDTQLMEIGRKNLPIFDFVSADAGTPKQQDIENAIDAENKRNADYLASAGGVATDDDLRVRDEAEARKFLETFPG